MWIGAIVKPDIVVGGPIIRGGGWVSNAALTPPHVVSVLSQESFHVFRGLKWELFILLILVRLLAITVHTFFSRVTRRVSHVEQGLLTSRFLEMFVLVDLLYVMFWRSLFVHLPFNNSICIGYPSLIYGFYNGICIGYPSLIYGFYTGICIGYPSLIYGFYNGICIGYSSLIYGFYNGICIGYPSLIYGFYNGICIGYPSLIYGFSLPVWYIQTFLS